MGVKRSWECFWRAVSTEISVKRGARGNRDPLIQSYLTEVLWPSVLTSSVRFINDFILTAQMNWLFSQQQLAFRLSGECLFINPSIPLRPLPDICSTCHLTSALTVGTGTLGSVHREEGGSIYVKAATLRVAVLSTSSGFQCLFLSSTSFPPCCFQTMGFLNKERPSLLKKVPVFGCV